MTLRSLPGSTYGDPAAHAKLVEAAFARSWQPGPDVADLEGAGATAPWRFAPGTVDEPLVTVRGDDGALRTLSNACTHRGALLVDAPGTRRALRCPYHGRRFGLDGRCTHAPGFADLDRGDDLPQVLTSTLGPMVWASLTGGPTARVAAGAAWGRVAPLLARPMVRAADDPVHELDVNWLVYVENYLEGLHVPFVHPGLAGALDLAAYDVVALPRGVLQVGRGPDAFDLPPGHPDRGGDVAAYYLWLWPDLMLNLYPWGLSVNHVQPLGPVRTRVVYRTYVADPTRRGQGAGGDLGAVEAEDQAIVARVQAGVTARLYRPGRLAPGHEDGVAALHALVRDALG